MAVRTHGLRWTNFLLALSRLQAFECYPLKPFLTHPLVAKEAPGSLRVRTRPTHRDKRKNRKTRNKSINNVNFAPSPEGSVQVVMLHVLRLGRREREENDVARKTSFVRAHNNPGDTIMGMMSSKILPCRPALRTVRRATVAFRNEEAGLTQSECLHAAKHLTDKGTNKPQRHFTRSRGFQQRLSAIPPSCR